ncbi:hypothetical protein F383_33546 [Gossypium arboreum]|uniref:Uncharacterized protein n=1 Tax=Gossypium arboreum TaxID=29729 RepID=A0A0B0PQB8_GOSAR|nr:hypothetical protein F383_33546 [Gossypium arboreum]
MCASKTVDRYVISICVYE